MGLNANKVVVNGGTSDMRVTTAWSSDFVVVAETGARRGYYEVPVSGALTETLTLSVAQDIPVDSLHLSLAAGDVTHAVGSYVDLTFDVIEVGTGDLQVTLSWNVDSDVDLHVVDPGGEEIFYANRVAVSGGELDLDSNAACRIDGVRNENITWPSGLAPRGTYTVRVDYWSSCGVDATRYTVRVNNGNDSLTFAGTLTGPGDYGGHGAGIEVVSFERTTGPTAEAGSRHTRHTQARGQFK